MRFHLKSKDIHPVPGNPHMLHLGTIGYGLREFVVMICTHGSHKGKCYIEEVVINSTDFNKDVFAYCKFIEDDNLAFDLSQFAEEHKLTDIKERINELQDLGKSSWLIGI